MYRNVSKHRILCYLIEYVQLYDTPFCIYKNVHDQFYDSVLFRKRFIRKIKITKKLFIRFFFFYRLFYLLILIRSQVRRYIHTLIRSKSLNNDNEIFLPIVTLYALTIQRKNTTFINFVYSKDRHPCDINYDNNQFIFVLLL